MEQTIVWGREDDVIYLGELNAVIMIARVHELGNEVLSSETWEQLQNESFIEEANEFLEGEFDALWEIYREEHDLPSSNRPRDWFPKDTDFAPPSDYEIFWWIPGIDNPDMVNLPEEFFELGESGGNMLKGDWHRWRESDLEHLEQLAKQLGYEFVNRQDLIERCTSR